MHIQRLPGILTGEISLVGSKSISNRLLIIEALSDENIVLKNLSDSDDTIRLRKSLKMIKTCASSRIPLVVDAANAGTVFRFLTALLALTEGRWMLTGSERMKKRPAAELVKALKSLGANIEHTNVLGFPPVLIIGSALKSKEIVLDVSESSQFVSALMMIAPEMNNGLRINFKIRPVSFPYIKMTAELMQLFGIEVQLDDRFVIVSPGSYSGGEYSVEPDWSSASYWYEIAALSDQVDLFLPHFEKNSLQGDRILPDLFSDFGVKTTFGKGGIRLTKKDHVSKFFTYNFENYPDLVPAVLATCAAKGIKANLKGVNHLKYKESDRLVVLKNELAKVGAQVIINGNEVQLIPSFDKIKTDVVFDSHDDHRMAMCLAPLAIKYGEVWINNHEVVQKSYPSFWKDIEQTGVLSVDKN